MGRDLSQLGVIARDTIWPGLAPFALPGLIPVGRDALHEREYREQ